MFLSFALITMQAKSTSVVEAEKLYAQKKYTQASALYEKILEKEGVAPELYYNLGNAYFKSNELGLAILNYERALRLDPGNDDAHFNLEFANQKVIDNVVMYESFFLKKWIDLLMKLLSSDGWFLTAGLFFIIMLTGVMIFIFGNSLIIRKSGFYLASVLLVLTIVSVIFAGLRLNQMEKHQEAIILSGAVVAKSSPDKSGTELFQLHEGTKVSVMTELGNWLEIKLGNGNIGWIETRHLERI
jgi:tetratricopeptide (TPR) repeat protein